MTTQILCRPKKFFFFLGQSWFNIFLFSNFQSFFLLHLIFGTCSMTQFVDKVGIKILKVVLYRTGDVAGRHHKHKITHVPLFIGSPCFRMKCFFNWVGFWAKMSLLSWSRILPVQQISWYYYYYYYTP